MRTVRTALLDEAVFHTLFPRNHPYYPYIIGSHADIESAQLADVRGFFRDYYVPNNATMVIVGDFDKARAKALVEKYFGPLPAGKPVVKPVVTTPPITAERRLVVTDKVELPRVSMSWLTPAAYKPGDAEADLLGIILGGGKASRLYRKLVYEQQIAQDVSVAQSSMMLTSVFQIEVTARPGVKPEQLEKAVDAELALLRDKGPTEAEVEQARNRMLSANIQGLETTDGVADQLNRYNQYVGTPDYLQQDVARYARLTPELLRAAANKPAAAACARGDLLRARRKGHQRRAAQQAAGQFAVAAEDGQGLARHAAGRRTDATLAVAGAHAVQAGQRPYRNAVRTASAAAGVGQPGGAGGQ